MIQISSPSEGCDLRVLLRQVRERRFLVGDKTDGHRLAFLAPSLQIPKDCNDAVIVGDIDNHDDLLGALVRPASRWHGERPLDPAGLSIDECKELHRTIRRTWEDALRLVAERYEDDELVQTGLRPPQIGAIHAVKAHWIVASEPATVVMPTGTGKTETMLSLLVSEPIERLLVVVPTDVLRTQLGMKFVDLGVLKRMGCLEPRRVSRRLQLLRRWSHDEQDDEQVFA